VSLNMVVGFLGELSLGHAGFMCVGAYIGCLAANGLKGVIDSPLLILIITMLIGGLVAAVFGFIIGLPALRLKGDYLAIVTLAFGEIVRNVFKNLKVFGGALGLRTTTYKGNLFVVAFAMVLITLFLVQNIIKSKHGRAITAIRDNEIAAKAMGVNVTYYKLFVFVMSAFFAGIAGVIYGHYASPVIYSFFSYNYSIEILVMVVLGGMGNIRGSIIAATLITYLNFQLQTRLSGDLAAIKFLVYAVILIVFIIFNNAPALKPLREKLSLRRIFSEKKLKKNPSSIKNDAAAWDKIPTKIEMDEMLSVDVTTESPYTPDKPEKKGERENG
ncbi:MAG: branched-chain amino acid ABC transporter permease, partial [Oscillospiraceae bacterium]|nr:branched-chain amino acid ABC transporter permease [Oscillospiraceae bacterium]